MADTYIKIPIVTPTTDTTPTGTTTDAPKTWSGTAWTQGANVVLSGYISVATSPAQSGGVRLANNQAIKARSTSATDVTLMVLNASDQIVRGGGSLAIIDVLDTGGSLYTRIGGIGGNDMLIVKAGGLTLNPGLSSGDFQGGTGVLNLYNASANPTGSPAAGIIIYSDTQRLGLRAATAATATNGTGEAMKANVEGYIDAMVNGTNVKIPYVKA